MAGTTKNREIEQITFEQMRPNDEITLKTDNSVYTFTVLDPARRIGSLIGGRLTERREVVLSGAVEEDKEFWGDGVRTGTRALFFLISPVISTGFNRLLTSEIESIGVRRSSGSRRAA